MNPQELQQKIAEYYAKLPPEAQKIFSDMAWLQDLEKFGTKYNLTDEQAETLGTETMLVLLGIIHVDEYEKILSEEIKISKNSLDELLADISDNILRPIRSKLTETFEMNQTNLSKEEEEKLLKEEPLDERFSELSTEAKEAIKNSNYQLKLFTISRDNQLSVDEMGKLENLIVDVILNKIRPEDFEAVLKDTLQTNEEKSAKIVNEINSKILKEIRFSLMYSPKNTKNDIPKEKTETEDLLEIKQQAKIQKLEPKKEIASPVTEKKEIKENNIQKNTKIEIMPEELPGAILEMPTENKIPEEKVLEKTTIVPKKPTSSISSEKFSNMFKTTTVQTEHSSKDVLNKPSTIPTPNIPPKPPATDDSSVSIKNISYKVDPYRELPQ